MAARGNIRGLLLLDVKVSVWISYFTHIWASLLNAQPFPSISVLAMSSSRIMALLASNSEVIEALSWHAKVVVAILGVSTHEKVRVILSMVLRSYIRGFQRSLIVLGGLILETVYLLHFDLLNLMLLYYRLELNGIRSWLVTPIGECVLVVCDVLLLDDRSKKVGICPCWLIVIVVWVIVVHVTKLERLLARLVAKVNTIKATPNLDISTKDFRLISFLRGTDIQRRVMEVTQKVRGRVMVRIVIWLVQVFSRAFVHLIDSSWWFGPQFLILIHLKL